MLGGARRPVPQGLQWTPCFGSSMGLDVGVRFRGLSSLEMIRNNLHHRRYDLFPSTGREADRQTTPPNLLGWPGHGDLESTTEYSPAQALVHREGHA